MSNSKVIANQDAKVAKFDTVKVFGDSGEVARVKLYTLDTFAKVSGDSVGHFVGAIESVKIGDRSVRDFIVEHGHGVAFPYAYEIGNRVVLGLDIELYRKGNDINPMIDSLTIENGALIDRTKGIMCTNETIILGKESELLRLMAMNRGFDDGYYYENVAPTYLRVDSGKEKSNAY
ncbi:MAG: hypothetical protein KGH98_02940 [Candidatus Micrarchaeota archaeon]|nr:hypothetical protein [Candidatus Micrarchaeota archaeon]